MKLSDNVYVYEWTNPFENNCNTFYIAGTSRVLIDPGLSAFVPDLLLRMKKDGINPDDIAAVVNTHSHPDHFQGSQYFSDRKTAVGLHDEEQNFMNNFGSDMYRLFELPVPEVSLTLPLREGSLEIGGECFELYHVPGHSPGSVALYWPSEKVLVSGDVIFSQNVGRTDFPGGSSTLLKESIRKLSELDSDYLLPGHMGIVSGKENVRLNFQFVIERILPYM